MLCKQKESAELAAASKTTDDDALMKRLKMDNKKLAQEQDALKESYKQMEMECLKLMDEVEKLHSDGLSTPAGDNDDDADADHKVARLDRQLAETKRHMEKLLLTHSSEMRQLKDQLQEAERNHHREIKTLHRDVAELETIIEAKIFKEEDLETALENERKVARQLRDEIKALKASTDQTRPYCELCESSDHSLVDCQAGKDTLERPVS
jgi:chromosome segregation ATPase